MLQSVTYGNGFKIGYSYDVGGQLTGKSYNDELRYTWKYGSTGEALEHVDIANNNLVHTYDYDSTGRYIRERAVDATQHLYTVEYGYDVMNNVTKIAHEAFGATVTQNYTYGKDNLPTKYQNSLSLAVGLSVRTIWGSTVAITGSDGNAITAATRVAVVSLIYQPILFSQRSV